MRRTANFDAEVSKRLLEKGRKYRQKYLLSYINDHDLEVNDALRETISDMGVKPFAELVGVSPTTINEFLSGKRNPKPETLDLYLEPFALKTKIVVEKLGAA